MALQFLSLKKVNNMPRSPSQRRADASYESKRKMLCNAKGSQSERDRVAFISADLSMTERDLLLDAIELYYAIKKS